MALSLNFILFFIGFSIAVLFGILIISEVSEANIQNENENCEDQNCIVNFNGADCLDCGKAEDNVTWILIAGIPFTMTLIIFLFLNGFENGFRIFGGLGGKKPSGGGAEPRKEDGWLGRGDF